MLSASSYRGMLNRLLLTVTQTWSVLWGGYNEDGEEKEQRREKERNCMKGKRMWKESLRRPRNKSYVIFMEYSVRSTHYGVHLPAYAYQMSALPG